MKQQNSFSRGIVLFSALALAGSVFCGCVSSRLNSKTARVSVSIDTQNPGKGIPADFEGLSFEVSQLLPNADGVHYFRPDNKPLINLFKTLGIKSLRIGGNTSDRDVRQLPGETDLDSLFEFAKAANVKVIYCLRLHNGDPQVDARTVKYIMDRYADQVDCFSIGQEPSAYPTEKVDMRAQGERMGATNEKYQYSQYRDDWKKFADVIIAAVPDVKLCGPSVHNNGQWAVNFMNDYGRMSNVVLVTEHLYPGGAGGKVPTPAIGIDRMLAGDDSTLTNGFPKAYKKLYDSFVPVCITNGLPYRLEEVNNYFNGGATNVSNTFGSALWGLDFMHWWAAHGCAGLNFHTGDKVAAGNSLQASKYTAYFSTTNGYLIRPLGYGIKAFELGGHGTNLPVAISNPRKLNLSAYASGSGGGNLYLTIINKEHGAGARSALVDVSLNDPGYKYGETALLTAPNGNINATTGVTIGGAVIQNNGDWKGTWTPLDEAAIDGLRKGHFRLRVPAASAVVLLCTRPNYDENKIGTFTLPDPLVAQNGLPVRRPDEWLEIRRPEILKLYEENIHGVSPKLDKMVTKVVEMDTNALNGTAIREQVSLDLSSQVSTNHVVLHVLEYTPANAAGPVPTFVCLSFSGNYAVINDPNVIVYPVWDRSHNKLVMPKNIVRGSSHSWKIRETLARGYGIAIVDYNDIEPDSIDGSGWKYGVRSLYLKPGERPDAVPDAWGAISAWAWGASRVVDYLETDPRVDRDRLIMLGQSRLGKTALWAGAEDPRFAMVVASCSGEMGAALSRRDYGETVTSMAKSYAYQFCPNFLKYSNNIPAMPVDSHMLISLIAPRPLYLNTGSLDRWSDPRGEFEAAIAAAPVYQLFGKHSVVSNLPPAKSLLKSGVLETFQPPPLDRPIFSDISFETHTGQHDILSQDWERFLDFADLHFHGKPPRHYPLAETETNP